MVAFLVAKMLSLPIYLRGSSYYLHTRVAGVQFKKSLQTTDKKTAIIRAIRLLEFITVSSKKIDPEGFDLSNTRTYEIDISRGVFRADGHEDHQMMMEALKAVQTARSKLPEVVEGSTEHSPPKKKTGLTMPEVLEKFFLVKSHLTPATILSYRKAINEFSSFLKNPLIAYIHKIDITKYQEYLATKKNTPRTIDNKIAVLGTVFNFAIKQGYLFTENPAKERKLQSNKDKLKTGYAIFEKSEIKQIFESDFFRKAKTDDPDYYWALVLGLVTGCRISEITSLTKEQFCVSDEGNNFIRITESKTLAGERKIPISQRLLDSGLAEFMHEKNGQIFKYSLRLGKGSGNAVGKKFARHLTELNINREKLVFHSLRKFCNNFLKENNVPYEVRCQFIGHEIEDINNTVYANNLSVDKLSAMLGRSILGLEMLAGIIKTKF